MAASTANKVLKFGPHLREIRIHLCQKSEASKGVREFIENHYVPLKKANPTFPILVRECSGIYPKIYARYGLGKESSAPLANLTSQDVMKTLKTLAEKH